MQTDIIQVRSNGDGIVEALEETTKFSSYVGLTKQNSLRLRLLAEETMGMVTAITESFTADFWLDSKRNQTCRIHLKAKTNMDYAKKRELIQTSSKKRNSASRGIMGKIRELIENGLYSVDEVGSLQAEYGGAPVMYGAMGICDVDSMPAMHSAACLWSLEKYRKTILEETGGSDEVVTEARKEAWDELEKSIVANLADDVQVAITGDTVEMIIEKQFGGEK